RDAERGPGNPGRRAGGLDASCLQLTHCSAAGVDLRRNRLIPTSVIPITKSARLLGSGVGCEMEIKLNPSSSCGRSPPDKWVRELTSTSWKSNSASGGPDGAEL